jgi:phosphatidylglycerophosphate synthase
MRNKISLIPSLITSIRVILAFVLLYSIINNFGVLSITLFLIAIASDAIDGYIARKLGVTSPAGAYFDIIADFILVLTVFVAFVIDGIYPYWILILIVLVFLQFIASSKFKVLIYDPLGKYYGSFLFLMIFITLLPIESLNYNLLLSLIVVFTLISLLSRYLYFIFRKINNK